MASTILTTNSDALSRAADAILARGDKPSKNAILNALAAAIAGPGHDWGFVKNAPEGQLVQPGLNLPTVAPTEETSLYVVIMDEREDWSRDPDAYTSLAALKQGLRDTYADLLAETGLSLDEAINKAICENGFRFPHDEADYEKCEQPCAINIHEFKISIPSDRRNVWALEMDEKSNWGWGTRLFSSKAAALAAAAETIPRDQLGDTSFEDAMQELARTGEFDSTPQDDVADDEDEDEWFERHDDAFQIVVREIPIEDLDVVSPDSEPASAEVEASCEILYHPGLEAGHDQGFDDDAAIFANREAAEKWAKAYDLDRLQPDWRDGLVLARNCKIWADFLPQVLLNGSDIAVDPQGDTAWEVDADELRPDQRDFDYLKSSPNAPAWVRDWSGSFEIYLSFTAPEAS